MVRSVCVDEPHDLVVFLSLMRVGWRLGELLRPRVLLAEHELGMYVMVLAHFLVIHLEIIMLPCDTRHYYEIRVETIILH